MTIATATRCIYDFAEGSRDMRTLLGGKLTIECGRLNMLQTRGAKRPAQTAVHFSVDEGRRPSPTAGFRSPLLRRQRRCGRSTRAGIARAAAAQAALGA